MSDVGTRKPVSRLKWILRFVSLLVVASGWEIAGRTLHLLLLPSFSETLLALFRLSASGIFWRAVWTSNQALLLGFGLASLVGVPFGLLLGRSARTRQFANLYLDLLLVVPISAFVPIVMGSLGVGLAARVAIVFLFSFSVIAISSASGTRSVDSTLVEMGVAFGASPLRLWTSVIIPSAFPEVMTGLRLGLARGIAGMVIVELLMVAAGIGGLILRYQADFEAPGTYAVIMATAAEAVILMKLLRRAESRVRKLFR